MFFGVFLYFVVCSTQDSTHCKVEHFETQDANTIGCMMNGQRELVAYWSANELGRFGWAPGVREESNGDRWSYRCVKTGDKIPT